VTNWILPSAIFTVIVPLTAGYLIGSVPIGLVVVRLSTGKNVLNEHSGRTGGTNVMRTAGFWAGLVTAIGDVLKGGAAVLLAQALAPGAPWVQAGAGILAVLGHNHSVFLMDRSQGRLRFRGGAGGATAVGCGIALSPALAWVILVVPLLLFGIGYASVATLSVGALMTLTLAVQANAGQVPWAFVGFGVGAEILMLLALRPNLERLRRGEERVVGIRARASRNGAADNPTPVPGHEVLRSK
jgi:glycerol-3-phosphate acyltransferase PlsY